MLTARVSRFWPILVAFTLLAPAAQIVHASPIEGEVVYLFDGNLNDSSGNGHNGTQDTSVSYNAGVPSITGSGYGGNQSGELDGTSGVLITTDASAIDLSSTDFTVEMWINRDANVVQRLFYSGEAPNFSNQVVGLYANGSGANNELRLILRDGTNDVDFTGNGGALAATETWIHVAAVIDRTNNLATLYVNGAQSGSAVDISGLGDLQVNAPGGTFRQAVGADYNGSGLVAGGGLDGQIDEFRLVLRALSAAEVAHDAGNSLVPEPASLGLMGLGGLLLICRGRGSK